MSSTINGYVELASPQLLDDKWRELNFDLASDHNVLQDFIMPESGSGYVYRDAKSAGTATLNRFLYWRTVNDILELIEVSTEVVLDGNQVRIRFANSPIINAINVIEFSDSVVIMIATLTSVHRIHLPHPKTTNKSILYELTADLLYDSANYYIINNSNSPATQQPICASSWADQTMLKCAISYPNSSILIVQFSINSHLISTSEIKQIGIIGRIWSRMPNLLTKSPNDCDNAVFVSLPYSQKETQDVLLFTLCRDWKIRLFSTNTRECVCTHSMIPQSSFSQSIVSHSNATTEQPMMKMLGSQVIIYLTENRPEFVVLEYTFQDGIHSLNEKSTFQTPNWEKLVDFAVTEHKIWALANVRETESTLCYLEKSFIEDSDGGDAEVEGVWDFVSLVDEIDMPSVRNYVSEIFWRNHFSIATVQKALIGVVGPSIPKKSNFKSLEELANTSIVENNQIEAWARFYDYCLQNHHASNKNIGLVVGENESIIGIVKRSNPSFVCPWLTSVDMVLQGGPYRGIEFSSNLRAIIEALNYISTDLIDEDHSHLLEQKIFENPDDILNSIEEMINSQLKIKKIDISKLNIQKNLINHISSGIGSICEQLDLSEQSKDFGSKVLQHASIKIRSEHNPLESNSGIIITFELFRRLSRARMNLARDLLIYIHLLKMLSDADKSTDKPISELCAEIYSSSKFRQILDSMRCYATMVWVTETPIKETTTLVNLDIINHISSYFSYFRKAGNAYDKFQDSTLESVLRQNLFMSFLVNGGLNYSSYTNDLSSRTLSSSFYVTEIALNLCRLLWPKSDHLCFAEFLFTHQLDEHLAKYLDLNENWLSIGEFDRHFIRAANCLLQNRTAESVDIFNRLWTNINDNNLIGRFIELDKERPDSASGEQMVVTPTLIHRYYDRLIHLFEIYDDHPSLVTLINQCMFLLDGDADKEQQHWLNCFRAKLFQYYLKLNDPDEAYHTMVMTTDQSLRTNCLRKFIVSHCEKQQWSNLLSYPYIDIKNDFIEILNQKAESSDLSKLNEEDFFQTSFYDLLFSSYVSDDEFRLAADVMYSYAQRLAHEVPGITSIRKQADCLLIALNSLRCVDHDEAFIEAGNFNLKEERTSVLKRSYDCESESLSKLAIQNGEALPLQQFKTRVYCKDIKIRYELTSLRLKLLEKDPTANAIALSPLGAEEIIPQLVASNMFSAAIDLALLMKVTMEPILEGLTAKYIFLLGLSSIDVAIHQDIERSLSEIFTQSYSNIDTYNFIANSTTPMVGKMWRLIDYYLVTHDGISHTYSNDTFKNTFSGTTVLMKVVAAKILSAGYNVPASLKRMYMSRNTPELLKLLIKYDRLVDAADLVMEMIDRILEPANAYAFTSTGELPAVYLPTHLILLLITFLNEDATNTHHMKTANVLVERLNKFRRFVGGT